MTDSSGVDGGGVGGCPCANETAVLASLSDRRCRLPKSENDDGGDARQLQFGGALSSAIESDKDGIRLTIGGACVPLHYGSSQCLQHDLLHDPACHLDQAGDRVLPAYCFRPWCFVDRDTCKRDSEARVYRSAYFPYESGVDVFYSYSACNSTAEDWLAVKDDVVTNRALGGVTIEAAVPELYYPMMFKRDDSGSVIPRLGDEYYDDSIPYEGVYINYINKIVEISKGDIGGISFTHRSRASSRVHPTSAYTAAVQDIEDGLVDMAVGPFWITVQRLRMSAFSIPVTYDKTFLVIPRPGTNDTLNDQIKKVLAPFSNELWGLVLVVIAVAAVLAVWFGDESIVRKTERRMSLGSHMPKNRRRKIAYARLTLDSFLQKGLFFCSAGVKEDVGASLPYQLLMFGFGFFILIAVSAYVANLAAFLTLSSTDSVKSMEGAVAAGLTICAHPALQGELQVAWPNAKFFFHADGNEFHGMLDDYEAGKCQVLAIGWEDAGSDSTLLEMMCGNSLVFTDSMIIEMPMGFPVRSQLAAGLSYWMLQGEKYHDTSIDVAKEEYAVDVSCDVQFSEGDVEASEYDEITVKNMFFPLVFFACSVVVAVVLKIIHEHNVKRGKRSLVGRISSMDLVEEVNESEGRHRNTILSKIRRTSYGDEEDPKDDFEDNEGGTELNGGDVTGLNQRTVPNRSIMTGIMQPDESGIGTGSEFRF